MEIIAEASYTWKIQSNLQWQKVYISVCPEIQIVDSTKDGESSWL